MNEQIRQFAAHAGFVSGIWAPDNVAAINCRAELDKFAELIVRECARIARATPCPYQEDEVRQRLGHTWDMASLEAGREIVKHFGVQE